MLPECAVLGRSSSCTGEPAGTLCSNTTMLPAVSSRAPAVSAVRDDARMADVTVYPPDEEGGRAVRVDGLLAGRAYDVPGIRVLLADAGLPDVDVASAAWIRWRGGGPDAWVH